MEYVTWLEFRCPVDQVGLSTYFSHFMFYFKDFTGSWAMGKHLKQAFTLWYLTGKKEVGTHTFICEAFYCPVYTYLKDWPALNCSTSIVHKCLSAESIGMALLMVAIEFL